MQRLQNPPTLLRPQPGGNVEAFTHDRLCLLFSSPMQSALHIRPYAYHNVRLTVKSFIRLQATFKHGDAMLSCLLCLPTLLFQQVDSLCLDSHPCANSLCLHCLLYVSLIPCHKQVGGKFRSVQLQQPRSMHYCGGQTIDSAISASPSLLKSLSRLLSL